jgi:putative transposase
VTKGAGFRRAGLVMAFKLLQAAQGHRRRLDGADLVPLVRAGIIFKDGTHAEPQPSRKRKQVAA